MSLILVDGSALFYRAHYAFATRPLTAPSGEMTSVAFGFFNSILKLIEVEKPTKLAVVFDVKAPTFRHKMYDQYKAQRKPMPEELAAQLPRLRELLDAWGIAVLEKSGFEADDVMATLARRSADICDQAWFYTGDKDFMQLLDHRIGMLKPGRRSEEMTVLTAEDVRRQYKLEPADLVQVFALAGDKSDNIPGAPGVGDKTALKIIQEFGTLETLYEKLDGSRLTPRLKRVLGENREQVFLSRDLFVIDQDVPVDVAWEDLDVVLPVGEKILGLLQELGLKRVRDYALKLADKAAVTDKPQTKAKTGAKADAPETKAATVSGDALDWTDRLKESGSVHLDTDAALQQWLSRLDPEAPLAVDTETDSLRPDSANLVGLSLAGFAVGGDRLPAAYVPVRWREADGASVEAPDTLFPVAEVKSRLTEVTAILGPVLADPRALKIGQNLKFDEWILTEAGLPLNGPRFDTMLASYVLDPGRNSHGLDDLVMDHLGHRMMPFKGLFAPKDRQQDILSVEPAKLAFYAAEDAEYTLQLYQTLAPELDASGMRDLFWDLEMPVSAVLLTMERHGIMIDKAFLAGLRSRFEQELADFSRRIHDLAGEDFNIQSPKQLGVILFDKLGLKPIKKTTTGWSTDVSVLTALAAEHELPALILEYRQVAKLQNTYVETLPTLANRTTGLIHTSYNQAVAATGRLSSSDPNLQNIPVRTELGRLIREAFVPRRPDHVFLSADYSQVELRLLAHLSDDPGLLAAFREQGDVHRRTAALIAGVEESEVSAEMRSQAKAINFGVIYGMGARALARQIKVKVQEASAFIEAYFETYPGVKRFIEETREQARRDGYVETLLGRRRLLPDIASDNNRVRSFQERIAVNTPIQGTAADLIKLAMLKVQAALEASETGALLLLQVHDELVLEVPEPALAEVTALVVDGMETVMDLQVPLVVDVHSGRNWAEAH